jgi:hypothetical protein
MFIHNTIGDILFVKNDARTRSLVLSSEDQYKEFEVYYLDADQDVSDVHKYSTLSNALRHYANLLETLDKEGF